MSYDEYPKVAKSHVQKSESERAFENAFCPPNFISRKIDPDFGKDYDVELGKDSSALNITFSVQLKSVGEVTPVNESKEIAFAIETSRLNYLSETLCGSLVVIYDASSKTLFYEWVDKLTAELDSKGTEWRKQDTTTIHVPITSLVNSAALQSIHQDVFAKHRRIQELRDTEQLVDAAKSGAASPDILKQQKPRREMLRLLSENGISLVATGLHKEVLTAYSLIPSTEWSSDANHLLAIAFAYEHAGLPLQALSHASAAIRCGELSLSAEHNILAKRLALISKVNLGQLDMESYYEELANLIQSSPKSEELGAARLELIFRELIRLRREEEHLSQVDKLVAEARDISKDESDWGQQLRLAKIEFQAGDQHVMNGRMQISMSIKLGLPMPMDKRIILAKKALGLKQSALQRIEKLCIAAEKDKRADVFAACRLELAMHQFSFAMVTLQSDEGVTNFSQALAKDPQIARCIEYADHAAKLFGQLGIKAMQIKALRLKADILNASGKKTEAQACMSEVRSMAMSLGIDPQTFQLTDVPSMDPKSVEDGIIDADESDLLHFARSMQQSINLPESRIPNILKDLKSVQQIHREKRTWCKHLELLQDLHHKESPATHYAIDPPKVCECLRYGYKTKISHPDHSLVIDSFKGTYCKDCPGKEV